MFYVISVCNVRRQAFNDHSIIISAITNDCCKQTVQFYTHLYNCHHNKGGWFSARAQIYESPRDKSPKQKKKNTLGHNMKTLTHFSLSRKAQQKKVFTFQLKSIERCGLESGRRRRVIHLLEFSRGKVKKKIQSTRFRPIPRSINETLHLKWPLSWRPPPLLNTKNGRR